MLQHDLDIRLPHPYPDSMVSCREATSHRNVWRCGQRPLRPPSSRPATCSMILLRSFRWRIKFARTAHRSGKTAAPSPCECSSSSHPMRACKTRKPPTNHNIHDERYNRVDAVPRQCVLRACLENVLEANSLGGKYPIATDKNTFNPIPAIERAEIPVSEADDGRRWYSCGLGFGISSREAEEPE